jgi:hypothetical protein
MENIHYRNFLHKALQHSENKLNCLILNQFHLVLVNTKYLESLDIIEKKNYLFYKIFAPQGFFFNLNFSKINLYLKLTFNIKIKIYY